MKLPGWQASISTGMPRKSPALQSSPAMVKPAVQRFVPLDNPNDYMRLGAAEAGKYAAVGKTISTALDVGLKIVEEDEAARANNAVAQYSEEMAQWTASLTTDKTLYTEVENEDGSTSKVYHWEDAEERFEAKAKEVQERLLGDNQFRTQRARLGLQRGFTTNDEQFRSKVQKFVGDRRVDRGRSEDVEALDRYKEAGSISKIEELRNDMIQGGRWTAAQAYSITNAAIQSASYTQTLKHIQQASPEGIRQTMQEAQSGTGMAKHMTVHQQQQVIGQGVERLTSIYAGGIRNTYNTKGPQAALTSLNELSDAGPAASGAPDELTHSKMMATLTTSLNRQMALDEARATGQAASNLSTSYFGRDHSVADSRGLAIAMDDSGNKKLVDASANDLVQKHAGNPVGFYQDPVIHQGFVNGALAGYVAKPFIATLESDIRRGSFLAIDKVMQINAVVPGGIKLAQDVQNKVDFATSWRALGNNPDVEVMNAKFVQIQNMDDKEKKIYAQTGNTNLEAQPPAEAFKASRVRFGLQDDGYFSKEMEVNPLVQEKWTAAYQEALPYVQGNHDRASDIATNSIMRSHGVSTATGTPTVEFMAPEALYRTPGREPGTPSADMDNQLDLQIDQVNIHLKASGKKERYDREFTRREYAGIHEETGEHFWILHDMKTNTTVRYSDGSAVPFFFSPIGPAEAGVEAIETNDRHGFSHIRHQEQVVANVGFEPQTFDDAPINPITGWVANTVTEAVNLNSTRWLDLSQDGKDEQNEIYNTSFQYLMSQNQQLLAGMPIDNSDIELKVHLFLASRGYMRGDLNGDYIRPPGGY